MSATARDPRDLLRLEWQKKHRRNPSYTRGAFARELGVPPGRLSEYLNYRRPITRAQAEKMAVRLAMGPKKTQTFFRAVDEDRQRGTWRRKMKTLAAPAPSLQREKLTEAVFAVIADWYHFAILNLIRTRGFRSDEKWIGQRLGLSPAVVAEALERLRSLNLIRWDRGRWVRTQASLATTDGIPSEAIRRSHEQGLARVKHALDFVPVTERHVSSMTAAIDVRNLEKATKLIRNFRRGLSELLEEGTPTEVYYLSVALVPLSRPLD